MLSDQFDLMFGHSLRQMVTGEHVEVWREPADQTGRPARFRKWFRPSSEGPSHAVQVDWNARETLMLQALEALGSEHVQVFDATSHSQDRSRRDLVTQHAGPTLEQWLALPVHRDGHSFVHVFQDCAHWFALARHALAALEVINRAGCLHLDIKADNLCIPLLGRLDPHQPEPFRLALDKLKLIDFAFSLWERRLPLEGGLGMGISEVDYQSRQLRAVIVDCEEGNFSRIRQLDWRTDLYGLGWMLQNLLDGVNTEPAWTGWNRDRLEQARALVRELQGYDALWQQNPKADLQKIPHQQFIQGIDDLLDRADWLDRPSGAWAVLDAGSSTNHHRPTPIPRTRLARHLKSGPGSKAASEWATFIAAPPGAKPPAATRVRLQQLTRTTLALALNTVTFGRFDPANDQADVLLATADPGRLNRVSTRHFLIHHRPDGFWLEDVSRWGIRHNGHWPGKDIPTGPLSAGDTIELTHSLPGLIRLDVLAVANHALYLAGEGCQGPLYILLAPNTKAGPKPDDWDSALPWLWHDQGGFCPLEFVAQWEMKP